MSQLNERIKKIIVESKQRNIKAYASNFGIKVPTLTAAANSNIAPRFTLLEAILKASPKVSAEWLMRGEGPMYKGEGSVAQESNNSDGNNNRQYDTNTVVDSDATVQAIDALREELRSKNEAIKQLICLIGEKNSTKAPQNDPES